MTRFDGPDTQEEAMSTDGAPRPSAIPDLAFIIATQAFLEAFRAGGTIEDCKRAVHEAGYRIVPVEEEAQHDPE